MTHRSDQMAIRDEMSETLFRFYDHGTQPNALVEADALLASPVVRRIQAEALRDYAATRYEAFLVNPDVEWMDQPGETSRHYKKVAEDMRRHADRIENGELE